MDLNEFLDRVTGAVGQSDIGQFKRGVDPNLDRQFREAEQRNMARAMQRAAEEERRRQSEFNIGIFTILTSRRGLPMEFRTINNLDTTARNNDEVLLCDENSYEGVNIWWRCDPEPEAVRNIFANITSRQKLDITWDNFRGTLINVFAEDLQDLFERGIHVKSRDDNGKRYSNLDFHFDASDAFKMKHRIAINIFRKNYTKCYNADNGIKDGCFITTAVCGSFGKADDCYELTTFRKFRDGWLMNQSDGKSLIAEYYSIAPRIVDKINRLTESAQIYQSLWQKYLEPCLKFIQNGDNRSCKNKYVEMIHDLKRQYL